jgi:hypothetical protein
MMSLERAVNPESQNWPPYLLPFEVEIVLRSGRRPPRPQGWSPDPLADGRLDAAVDALLAEVAGSPLGKTVASQTSIDAAQADVLLTHKQTSELAGKRRVSRRVPVLIAAGAVVIATALITASLGTFAEYREVAEEAERLAGQIASLR